jgi:heparanase 1
VRVSGTWANTTYFPAEGEAAPEKPPPGFGGVLTPEAWSGAIDFARAVDARIVTSFANGPSNRDAWTPDQARRFIDYTKSKGGTIAAAEFMNEPTLAAMGGAPKGYDAAAYGRDFKAFRAFAKRAAPACWSSAPARSGRRPATPG